MSNDLHARTLTKHLAVFKALMIVNARNRKGSYPDLFFGGATTALRIVIFAAMYRVAYGSGSDPRFIGAVWSIGVAQVIFSLDRPDPTIQIGQDIKEGSIAIHLLRPLNYVNYVISSFIGKSIPGLVASVLFIFPVAFVITKTIPIRGFEVILCILLMILGILVVVLIATFFGLCGFWTEDTNGFQYISHKMALLFGGLIIPLSVLPDSVRSVVNWMPWTVGLARPGYLLTNFSYDGFYETLVIQLLSIAVLYFLCIFLMNKGVSRLNISGG